MYSFNKKTGIIGESIAERYLKKKGYKIVTRNFRCKLGEIDIIAKDRDFLVFIEVKTRYNLNYGLPKEAVSRLKQRKILGTSKFYIVKNNLFNTCFRFDVVEVFLNDFNSDYFIKLTKNAFA